jgi:hypothetical protein
MTKCKQCGQLNRVHKMSCESRKITIMADITKCTGKDCKLKESCYRYIAKESEFRQAYFAESPINKDGFCNMYWSENQNAILNHLKDITNGKTK